MSDENFMMTPMHPWKVLRVNGPEDGAAAASILTGFTFHQKKALCIDLYELFRYKFSDIIIAMYGDAYSGQDCDDDDTFAFDLIGYRSVLKGGWAGSADGYNPPMRICSAGDGLAVVGTARASGDGGVSETGRWLDTLTLSNDEWPGGVNVYADGDNKMLFMRFDANGIRYIYPYVWDALGAQAGECPGVGMIITAI